MPQEEFELRFDAVRREMARQNLDAIVVYGDNYSFGDLCYLTNYFPKVRGGICLVPRSGALSLLLNIGSRDVPFAKTLTWVEDVRASAQVGRDGAGLLKERGFSQARVALVDSGRGLPLPELDEMKSALPQVDWQSNPSLLEPMRLHKSARELAALRNGAALLKQICDGARELVKQGRKEYEVIADIDRLARDKGVEDVRVMAGAKRLQPPSCKMTAVLGEHWAIYLAIQHERYWVEAGRTYVSPENAGLHEAYRKAQNIVARMAARLKPGAAISAIEETARERLGECHAVASMYGLGNGIGLGQWEPPFLSAGEARQIGASGNPAFFEAQMTLALRVIFESEGRLVLFGDTYVITQDGPKSLVGS